MMHVGWQNKQNKNKIISPTFLMVAMKSNIAEVKWKRMMKAKTINMAGDETENLKQENL